MEIWLLVALAVVVALVLVAGLTPTAVLEDTIGSLLGADTTGLAEGTTFVAVHLAKAVFTPSRLRVIGDMTEATFDGYAALHAASAATQVTTDPANGDTIIQVREPAGGWHWATSGVTALPQTIYGFYLTNAAGTVLLGCQLFGTPVVFTGTGQGLDIGQVRFRLPSGALA